MEHSHRHVEAIDFETIYVARRDDGIIHVYFKDHCEINVKVQEQILLSILRLQQKDKLHPVIFEAGEFISLTPGARKNANNIGEKQPVSCFAIIIKNAAQRLLVNYYYKLEKPLKPTKSVKDMDSAVNYCMDTHETVLLANRY